MKKNIAFKKISIIVCITALLFAFLVFPSSAESISPQATSNVIPKGIYAFNDYLYDFPSVRMEIPMDILVEANYEGTRVVGLFDSILYGDYSPDGREVYFGVEGILPLTIKDLLTAGSTVTVYREGFVYEGNNFLKTFTILNDVTVTDPDSLAWFNLNVHRVDYVPEGSKYIPAGYYTAREPFPVSRVDLPIQSNLYFQSFDQITSSWESFEGFYMGVVNDSVIVSYLPEIGLDVTEYTVFVDGWQSDSLRTIRVTRNTPVTDAFYEAFNVLYYSSDDYEAGFSNGYADGYDDGFDDGYDQGYTQGYYVGSEGSGSTWFGDIIGDTLSALDRFVIFNNFSLLDLYSSILGVFALTWLLKLLAGG